MNAFTGLARVFRGNRDYRAHSTNRRRRKLPPLRRKTLFEPLEGRLLLSVTPTFLGSPFLAVGADVNITQAAGNQTETTIAVNPTSPNQVFAVSNPGSSAAISTNGGTTFTTFNSDAGLLTSPDRSCCDNDSVWDNFGNL